MAQLKRGIVVGKGRYGGGIIHNSASTNKIQYTYFTEDGKPIGHTEYNTIGEAVKDNWKQIDHPVFNLRKSCGGKEIFAWEEATFESPIKDELFAQEYQYVSIYRPLSGVMVDGLKSANKDGKIGVLYRDEPLPLDKQISLQLFPISNEAMMATSNEIALAL